VQQRLPAAWLDDAAFPREVMTALAGCLDHDDLAAVAARDGLLDALYAGLDPAPIMPTLLALRRSQVARCREIAAQLLAARRPSST